MATEQATPYKDMNRNPSGKGGFGDNPKNRNPGGWDKTQSISYQYNRLMRFSPEELIAFKPETVAEKIAMNRVKEAYQNLNDVKEITDRTEGKAPQTIDLMNNGDSFEPVVVRIISEPQRNTDSD